MKDTKKQVVVIVLEDTLISTLSGKSRPSGLWDYRISWPVWNSLRELLTENDQIGRIVIVSNQGGIGHGFISDRGFWSKINFISECLHEVLKIPVSFRYSLRVPWKLGLDQDSPDILEGIHEVFLMIGRDIEFDRAYSEQRGLNFMTVTELIKKYKK